MHAMRSLLYPADGGLCQHYFEVQVVVSQAPAVSLLRFGLPTPPVMAGELATPRKRWVEQQIQLASGEMQAGI